MKTTFTLLCVVLTTAILVPGMVYSKKMKAEDIDPSGMLGPDNPRGKQFGDDPSEGGIYIAKQPDDIWHVVGGGMLPWGGTQVEMVAFAVNADGSSGKMGPAGEYVDDGNDDDNVVFDSPEGGQIDWIKIKGNRIDFLTWFNGTGAWDGIWFEAEGDFVLFETLGMNNEETGGVGSSCDEYGDRGCLIQDPLPLAPKERIFIGGDAPGTWENPSTETPFALKNRPDAPDTLVAVEPKDKEPTTWGSVKKK